MNRELYIHTLSQFRDECDRKHMDTETEAFNAAIQALSADGDCISRQVAIDAIDRLDIPEDMCVFEILSHIELEIGTLPSAQPDKEALDDAYAHGYTYAESKYRAMMKGGKNENQSN